jgi:hypothetical protein
MTAAAANVPSAHAENRVYPWHCTQSDYFPPGMACKNTYAGGTRRESKDRTVWIAENTWAQSQPERASPKCTIQTLYKTNPPCVVDPAPNEPTCNHEARMAALYQAFPPCEARRVLRRLEFHYVPKHASWLNMVEIEIGVLRGQCLDRRIATPERLVSQIAAWERQRNATRAQVKSLRINFHQCKSCLLSRRGLCQSSYQMTGKEHANMQVTKPKPFMLQRFLWHIGIVKPVMPMASKPKNMTGRHARRLTTAGVQTRPPSQRKQIT